MSPHAQKALRVLVLAGSHRGGSLNYRLAELANNCVAALGASVELARLEDFECPLYDGDIEHDAGVPEGATRFCERLKAADALIVASPEYNASMPAVLKNLIDWASRFRPQPFNGHQIFLMSASPSMVGGNRGLWSLRVPLEHLGARVYPDMFSLAQAHQAFGQDGRLQNPVLQDRFEQTLRCFLDLVEAATHYPALKKQWVEFLGEHPDRATDRVETADVGAHRG